MHDLDEIIAGRVNALWWARHEAQTISSAGRPEPAIAGDRKQQTAVGSGRRQFDDRVARHAHDEFNRLS
ncbi:MAG TPA: hypothetical protein VLA10_09425 [Ilumatobacter sp.]|nr:hypothetical protein [Ilumatobacter sp.]